VGGSLRRVNGFAINMGETHISTDVHDARDGDALLQVLGDVVVPLYYNRDRDGFSADRMVKNYLLKTYIPAARLVRVET